MHLSQSDTLARLEQAEQLKLMGQYEEALSILEQLLIEDPENVSALEEVADNELSLEHFDRARVAAKRAVTLDKESYTAHYIIGFLHTVDHDWAEATGSLQKANLIKPNNPEILRCLGWSLFCKGDHAQGLVTLERAMNLDPENPLIMCDLGVSYLKSRNITKAKALFSHALDIDPSNVKAQECMKAVERLEKGIRKQQKTVWCWFVVRY